MKKKGFPDLLKSVIKRGLCTGCGTCVGVCPTKGVQFDFDAEEPNLAGTCKACGICYQTCPGKDIPLAKLEEQFLGACRTREIEFLGISKTFLKGFAKVPEIRQSGASGGLTTALLIYALERGLIDGAVVTIMDAQKPWRVKPTLAKTRTELIGAAKSKYAISPNNMALREAEGIDALAVVGLPCHIHGIRKLQSNRDLTRLAKKIILTLGLFCGTNQSYKATEYMIQEYSDVNFAEIERFEYRGGVDSQDVKIFTRNKKEVTITYNERKRIFRSMGKDRCRMCCDWTAELSDLSLGEITDPQYNRKIPNWNSIIVRTEKGLQLIEGAQEAGFIETSFLEENSFYRDPGFEAKKHGAVYNLMERKRYGWPVPNYHYEFTRPTKRIRGSPASTPF